MQLTAITRDVSPSTNACELSFHRRQRIHVPKAIAQHEAYRDCLAELGARMVNRSSIDVEPLQGFELLDVPAEEPNAANALLLNGTIIISHSFPSTCALLKERGFRVRTVDVSELQKAEAGVTCCSVIFEDPPSSRSRGSTA